MRYHGIPNNPPFEDDPGLLTATDNILKILAEGGIVLTPVVTPKHTIPIAYPNETPGYTFPNTPPRFPNPI